jgi:WD40 repeat protein
MPGLPGGLFIHPPLLAKRKPDDLLRSRLATTVLLLSGLALAEGPAPRPLPRALAFAPDGRTLAVGSAVGTTGELALWDVRARKPRWQAPQGHPVRALAWTADGKALVIAVGPSALLVAPEGKPLGTIGPHGTSISCLALTADGRTLATGSAEGTIKLWDVAGRKERRTISGHRGSVGSVCFSPEGKLLVSTGGRGEAPLWDTATGKVVREWKHDSFFVAAATFTPDGKMVVTGGYDGNARLWDVATGALRAQLRGLGGLDGVVIEPATQTLAVWGTGRAIGLFDLDRRPPDAAKARRIAALLRQLDEDSYARREAATRDLRALGWVAEPAVRKAAKESPAAEVRIRARAVLAALQGEPGRVLRGHTGRLRDVCFTRDGKLLASGGDDGTVRLWDPQRGREVGILGR